jgi:hypothetical protein
MYLIELSKRFHCRCVDFIGAEGSMLVSGSRLVS